LLEVRKSYAVWHELLGERVEKGEPRERVPLKESMRYKVSKSCPRIENNRRKKGNKGEEEKEGGETKRKVKSYVSEIRKAR